MNKLILTASAAALALAASAGYAAARDQIQVAGSSTVLPYAKIVAETFVETFTNFKTPVVESGGSGAGMNEFCNGCGETNEPADVEPERTERGNRKWYYRCSGCGTGTMQTRCFGCGSLLHKNGQLMTYHLTVADQISNVVCYECGAGF